MASSAPKPKAAAPPPPKPSVPSTGPQFVSYTKLTKSCDDLLEKSFIISTLFGVSVKSSAETGLNLSNKYEVEREDETKIVNKASLKTTYVMPTWRIGMEADSQNGDFVFTGECKPPKYSPVLVKTEVSARPNSDRSLYQLAGKLSAE
jgi:hypothetical protein